MTQPTEFGHNYRRKLPHYRTPGAIYHARFSIHSSFGLLKMDRDFLMVQNAIMFWHKRRCMLIAYVVMPNHTHLLLQPLPKENTLQAWCDYTEFYEVEKILGSVKKFSAKEINKIHCRRGKPLWMDESFDRTVRNDKDLDGLVDYIHGNPVRWGLVRNSAQYRWSSASTIYSGTSEFRDWFVMDDFTS